MIRSQKRENRKRLPWIQVEFGDWWLGAEVCKHLVCPTVKRQRGAVVQWRAWSLSLALSQRSSGKQQQHKPNPCNRVSASSTSVYSGVIQCPPLPSALSLVFNCPPSCVLFDSVFQKRFSYFLHKRSDDYMQVVSLAWSSLLGEAVRNCTWAQETCVSTAHCSTYRPP